MPPSAYLPPELVDHIINFIALPGQPPRALVSSDKHELALLSLTCRSWAARLQPLLFSTLRLKSQVSLRELLALLSASHGRLGGYITVLQIAGLEQNQPTWLHLVLLVLIPKLPARTRASLRIEIAIGPTAPRWFGHSLYTTLPRSPPFSSPLFHKLTLSGTRFRSPSDLLRLVASMPLLETITCYEVEWGDSWSEAQNIVLPLRRTVSNLKEVYMLACSSCWEALGLFVGARWLPSTPVSEVNHDSLESQSSEGLALCRIAQSIKCTFITNKSPYWGMFLPRSRYDVFYQDGYTDILYRSFSRPLATHYSAPNLTFTLVPMPHGLTTTAVSVDFYVDVVPIGFEFAKAESCDWDTFLGAILALPSLERLNLGFRTRQQWTQWKDKMLSSDARTIVHELVEAGRVICAFQNEGAFEGRARWISMAENEEDIVELGAEFTSHFYGDAELKG